jgi:hypothetical protein
MPLRQSIPFVPIRRFCWKTLRTPHKLRALPDLNPDISRGSALVLLLGAEQCVVWMPLRG